MDHFKAISHLPELPLCFVSGPRHFARSPVWHSYLCLHTLSHPLQCPARGRSSTRCICENQTSGSQKHFQIAELLSIVGTVGTMGLVVPLESARPASSLSTPFTSSVAQCKLSTASEPLFTHLWNGAKNAFLMGALIRTWETIHGVLQAQGLNGGDCHYPIGVKSLWMPKC